MILRRLLKCLLPLCLIPGSSERSLGADSLRRVAILPALADFEIQSDWRRALSGFDARIQAELLKGWQVDVLSRAGLSAVVFEQKLRAATDPKVPLHRVLPADVVVLTVFDFIRKELRLYTVPVGDSMKVGSPTVLNAKSPADLITKVPAEAARTLARIGGLHMREPVPAVVHPNSHGGGQRLVCALLDPMSPEGMLETSTLALAPWIRAGLEQAIATGNAGAVQLVERNEMARLIDEKTLKAAFGSRLEMNVAAQFGRMVKADLILVPFVYNADQKKVETDIFALEVSTGRLLACLSWKGALVEAIPKETISAFLQEASVKSRERSGHATPDDAKARHAEASFLASVPTQGQGLRMRAATEFQAATRMADAALALSSDSPELMEKISSELLPKALPGDYVSNQHETKFRPNSEAVQEAALLRKSGQTAVLQGAARRVFELPLKELQRQPSNARIALMASFWNRLGEHQQALQCVTTGGKQAGGPVAEGKNDPRNFQVALAYMRLGRYKECAETLARQGTLSFDEATLTQDAYRAAGDEANEFKFVWNYYNFLARSVDFDRHARLIDLAVRFGKAKEALQLIAYGWNDWARSDPAVQLAIVRARIAIGQKDLAVSDAQCALLGARKEKNAPAIKELEQMLASLNSKPLEHLLRAGDFIHLPADCVIHLLHDQTIPPAHARAVAEHLARFWGCPVQIWPVNLDARKLTFFRSFAQSLDAPGLHRLLMGTALPSQRYLGRVFLTREKVGRILSNNAMGDLFGWSTPRLSVLSDHYFMKYSHLDRRPLALIDAIAASSFRVVTDPIFRDLRSDDDIANDWAPIPPEVFSNNGRLVMDRQELGISPRSAAILQRMTLDQIAAAQDRHEDMKAEREIEPKDRPIAEDLSRQLRGIKPETVSPQVPGNPGNGTPQGQ